MSALEDADAVIVESFSGTAKSPDVNADAAEGPMTERLRDGMRPALNGGELPWGRTLVDAARSRIPIPS